MTNPTESAKQPFTSSLPPLKVHDHIYGSILELIHDTPLVLIPLESDVPRARVWGKLESVNPGGSVKDRICLSMIEKAERDGHLKPGGVVVEPTSGNTGIGLALICRHRGYRCILTMPESMSLERRAVLEGLGAELVLTPAEQQMPGAITKAEEIAREKGGFVPHQFENTANPETHAQFTAKEILHALEGDSLDAFVAGVGTGGTITGVGRVLRVERPNCRLVGVEPESCATITRGEVGPTKIQGWAAGFVPQNFDRSVCHEVRTVTDALAQQTKRALAREAGMLMGISSGGALRIALDIAKELRPDQNVVVVLPDTGERYFSLDEYFAN